MYKCTEVYKPEQDAGFAWNDPDVGIRWPEEHTPVISAKDAAAPRLRDLPPHRLPVYPRPVYPRGDLS